MKKINPVVWAVLAVPVIYMAMVLACSYEAGTDLFALMERFGLLLGRPDLLRWTAYTPRCILGALVCYGLAVTLYYSDHENRRPGEEYGSAKWGSARELNKQYAAMNGSQASVSNPSTDTSQVFKVADEQPEFVGGQTALANYLGNNVVYPTVAIQNNIQGRVIVSFIIEKDGSVSNVELISGVDPLLDAEALRVVKAMPSWTPGKINGKPVRTQYALPITFRL